MSRLDNVAKKADSILNNLVKIVLEKSDILEKENRVLRQEILRLEQNQQLLIKVLSENVIKRPRLQKIK